MITKSTIPAGWRELKLGDLGTFKNGVNKSSQDFGHGKPFVNLMDIFGKPSTKMQDFSLVNVTKNEINNYNLKKGDVLFVRSSIKPEGVGLTTLIEEDLNETVYSGFIIRFRENGSNFAHKYKKHCFYSHSFRRNLIAKSSISANTNINQEALATLELLIPPLPEQKKIAEVLDCWDDYLERLSREIKVKKSLKKGLMQELLTGKIRLPGFSGDWMRKELGETCSINPKSNKLPSSFVYIDLESVEKGVLTKERVINLNGAPSRAQRLLEKKDILFQTVRPYQRNNLYFDRNGEYVASTGYAQIRTKNNSRFIYYVLHTDNFVNKVLEKCIGSNYPSINSNDLAEIEIKLPSLEEQTAIANILASADKEIEVLEKKKQLIEKQKMFLLNHLISGDIRFPEFQ